MGIFILKFFLMSTILGGMLKAYIDLPIVHEHPKTVAAIVIAVCFMLITLAPKYMGTFFKIILVILLIGGIGFLLYSMTGIDFEKSDKKEEKKAEVEEELENMEQFSDAKDSLVGVVTSVRSGYLFKVGASFLNLYAIDGPDPKQTCRDSRGQKYPCGLMSKEALERLILGKKVICSPVGSDGAHNYVVTCRVGQEDVGAVMVRSGWALANQDEQSPYYSNAYVPYEKEANKARKGLWEGKFEAPWNWRKKKKGKK